jgi:hypothetical protein
MSPLAERYQVGRRSGNARYASVCCNRMLPYPYDQSTKLSRNALANADRMGSPLPGKKTELARSVQASRMNVSCWSGTLSSSDENASGYQP